MNKLPQFKTLQAVRAEGPNKVWLRVLEQGGEVYGEGGEFPLDAYLRAAQLAQETKQPDKIILEWFYANF